MESQNDRLKGTADDYYRQAITETDGTYRGALVGMRSVFAITEHEAMEKYLDQLLNTLSVLR